ncbi:MAG: SDR family oxidoreductase [Dehalococcoidia bacterium]|nr:SDR family oxidoreductase [Dehalococcoidia bacterium]
MDLGLSGKTVIVTGGASNIGRGISLAFAKEGVNLAIADLDIAQAEKTAADAVKLGAKKAIAIKTDVTDMDNVQAMVKQVLADCGRVDVLVNNVGFDIPKLFTDTTPEFWDKLIAVNYKGMLNCTRAALDPMIAQKSGAIVSISSEAGRIGEFREAVYAGTKGGVIAFSKAIARENGPKGIRVNVVCPGMTVPDKDEIGEQSVWQKTLAMFPPDALEKIAKGYPLRRVGKAKDVADAVVFLASDAAGYITGQTLSVSGGYSMM